MTQLISTKLNREGVVYSDRTRTIELDNGTKIIRDVITKNPCVVALVVDTGTTTPFAILVNEFRVGTMQRENGFPAGIVDDGETPIQAIVREVIEETGMIPHKVEYLGDTYTSSGFTNEHIHHFYIEVNSKNKREQELDHDEQITLVHVPINDVLRYIESGKLTGNHAHATMLKYILKNYQLDLTEIKN